MSKNIAAVFRPTTLAYSSPALDTTRPVPACFYNAFPDLNDVAPDGSWSAFPIRAKYILPLDSVFLPSARWVNVSNSEKYGHQNVKIRVPRKPELNETCRFENLFEISHKRLAATDYKWVFRISILAPFYTALEEHLVRGKKIGVPLVANPHGSMLQRHWKTVLDTFKPTLFLDEAASLLICLILLPPAESKAHERVWVTQQAAEIRGFANFYQKLRDEFDPESAVTAMDRNALAERILKHAKEVLSSGPRGKRSFASLAEELYGNLEEKNQRVVWPRLLGEGVHGGLRQLRMRNDLVLGKRATRISIPEAMQQLMAFVSVLEDKEQSFTYRSSTWSEYVVFSLESAGGFAYPHITSENSVNLRMLVNLGIQKPDGSGIDPNPNCSPTDALLIEAICRYTILLEAIRQQLCTGVGLRCPFWKGAGCCEFRPLLQRTYEVAKPYLPEWKCHWQKPPCLA